jgi:hypothetical protein
VADFEFVDELPSIAKRTDWRKSRIEQFAEALRRNPGKWAKYPMKVSVATARSRAAQINHCGYSAFEHGSYEGAVRAGVLYVRAVAP